MNKMIIRVAVGAGVVVAGLALGVGPAAADTGDGSYPQSCGQERVYEPGSEWEVQNPVQNPGTGPEWQACAPGTGPEWQAQDPGSGPEWQVQDPGTGPEWQDTTQAHPERQVPEVSGGGFLWGLFG